MGRRRRSRSQFDPILLGVTAIVLFSISAWTFPGLAFSEAVLFTVVAVAVWYTSAAAGLRKIHRWGAISNMYALSSEEFERHVAATYSALGYRVATTKRIGDQGIDVLAERGNERIGIQCKRTTETVSNSAVQEAYAGKAHYACTSAVVVSLGGFTSPARALAATTGVSLMDGLGYADLFHRASATRPARSLWTVLPARRALLMSIACMAVALIALSLGVTRLTSHVATAQYAISAPVQPLKPSPGTTVQQFYAAISAKRFREAYALLSPGFKKSQSFESFRRGYNTTLDVRAVTAEDGGTMVSAHLVATDRNRDGSSRVTNYDGHWSVVSDGNGGWLLDEGAFKRS
jgi:hypothetical protein